MDAILHIENVSRPILTPLSIGDHDYIFFGNSKAEHDNDYSEYSYCSEHHSGYIELGYPLNTFDVGDTRNSLPLIKTFEFFLDPDDGKSQIFTENFYYVKNNKKIIPYRTKILNGPDVGKRYTHLPSLNLIRSIITGLDNPVIDPKLNVIYDLLDNDVVFRKMKNHCLIDWIREELTSYLSHSPVNEFSLTGEYLTDMIYRYISKVESVPFTDLSSNNLKDIVDTICSNFRNIPLRLNSSKALKYDPCIFRSCLIPNTVNLQSHGNIDLRGLPRIVKNPHNFCAISDRLDKLSYTDINLELIFSNKEIVDSKIHVATNRMSAFKECSPSDEEDLEYHITPEFVKEVLSNIVNSHPLVTEEITNIIADEPVKLKIIKTITDENLILLYKCNSDETDKPLCGIYFDIPSLSLSPISVIRSID